MIDRIKRIMDEKGLRPSTFADAINVTRGTISHILNGRNDPRKETIDKILIAFPDISPLWLWKGEGAMYKRVPVVMQPSPTIKEPDLFGKKNDIEPIDKRQIYEIQPKKEIEKPENSVTPVTQNINLPIIPAKKIDKIMIFYNDNTFLTFIPEEK